MIKIKEVRGKVDFGIITVKPDEFGAVLQQFKMNDSVVGTRRYALSTLKTKQDTEYLVALVRSPHQGFSFAQQTAEALIADLDPNWILLVGIGGGVPDNEFTLGDVVLGVRFVDFSVQAALQDKPPEFDMRGSYAHPEVEDLLAYIPALAPVLEGWTDSIPLPLPKVKFDPGLFEGDPSWQKKVRKSLKHHFQTPKIRRRTFWPGTIGTSNTLIKDSDLVLLVSKFARSINAFEMEAGGVLVAARKKNREYPVLDVRGLSDIVGYKREGAWTEYACHSAASFAYWLLKTGFHDARTPEFARPLAVTKSKSLSSGSIKQVKSIVLELSKTFSTHPQIYPDECDEALRQIEQIDAFMNYHWVTSANEYATLADFDYVMALVRSIRGNLQSLRDTCPPGDATLREEISRVLNEIQARISNSLKDLQR